MSLNVILKYLLGYFRIDFLSCLRIFRLAWNKEMKLGSVI